MFKFCDGLKDFFLFLSVPLESVESLRSNNGRLFSRESCVSQELFKISDGVKLTGMDSADFCFGISSAQLYCKAPHYYSNAAGYDYYFGAISPGN